MWLKEHLILIIFLLLFSDGIIGQSNDSFPTLFPAHSENFEDLASYPSLCFRDVFQSSDGRLWFIPCSVVENNLGLRLLQFDGYAFRSATSGLDTLDQNTKIRGIYKEDILVGYSSIEGNNQIIFYDVIKEELKIIPFKEKGTIQNISVTKDDRIFVVSQTQDRWLIWEWKQGKLDKNCEVSKPPHWTDEANSVFVYPYQDGEDFWVTSTKKLEFLYFNKKTSAKRIYKITDFKTPLYAKIDKRRRYNDALVRLTKASEDSYYIIVQGLLYQLDLTTNSFEFLKGIDERWMPLNMFTDKKGNIVFVFEKDWRQLHAVLMDKEGKLYDYGPLVKKIKSRSIVTMASPNFKKEVYICASSDILFETVQASEAIKKYPTFLGIRSMYELDTGQFIISQEEPPLRFLNVHDRKITVFPGPLSGAVKAPIFRFNTDTEGKIWFYRYKNLVSFDPASGKIQEYPTTVNRNILLTSFIDNDRMVLADQNQIYFFDLTSLQTEPYLENGQAVSFPGVIQDILYSRDNYLWVASSKGLWRIDLKTGRLYSQHPFLPANHFLCLHEDEKGRLWLGTSLSGLIILDPSNQSYQVLNDTQGLPNNTVVSIVKDDEGYRWIGTYRGVSMISPEGNVAYNISPEEGLAHSESNRYAYLKARDGKILIGTIKGLSIIDPQKIKEQIRREKELQIYLTAIRFYDKEKKEIISKQNNLGEPLSLDFPASKRFLHLTVSLSEYFNPAASQYAYKLEGLNQNWNYLGKQNSLSLNALPAGKYRLLIKGADHLGNWTKTPLSINIRARDYFYRQTWFLVLLMSLVSIIAYYWIRRLRLEKTRLEVEVKRRTQKIEEDKKTIEAQALELQQLDEMKSRFFTNIAHELRTPITLITAPVEQILGKANGSFHNGMQNSLKLVLRNGRKLLRLVEELFELSRLEANKTQLNETETSLSSFCRQIFSAFQSKSELNRIDYQFDSELNDDEIFAIDRDRLEKILSNLLSNAFKFTPPEGKIYMQIVREEQDIFINIEDSGPGISAQDLPHIFNRYYQTKKENIHEDSGLGIGLALSNELARLMHGNLSAQSEVGKGSIFTLCFAPSRLELEQIPLTETPATKLISEPVPTPVNALSNKGEKPPILVVEDNPDMQILIQSILEEEYDCRVAHHGAEAWNWIESKQIKPQEVELVLSDIMMPQMDGYELLNRIKKHPHWQRKPIVMLTARSEEEDKLQALRLGVDDYLLKPFSPVELKVRLANLIRNAKERQAFLEKEGASISFQFEQLPAADQSWLQNLEAAAKKALDRQIDLSKSYLADQMALSERQLLRRLKALTGLTIQKYILEIKLQKARHFLENKAFQTVSEVAFACGFNSAGYFSRLYEQHFGKRPSNY